jgi:hypothetical protein
MSHALPTPFRRASHSPSEARRAAAVLALLALLAALPAPAFAAPRDLRPTGPGEVLLGWFQELAARLGFAPGGSGRGAGAKPQAGFSAATHAQVSGGSGETETAPEGDLSGPNEQIGSMMDPDG